LITQDSPKTDSIDIYGEFFPERKKTGKVQKKEETKDSDDDKCGSYFVETFLTLVFNGC
jgi:hypothetical protein